MRKRLGVVAAVGGFVFGLWLDEPADRVTTVTVTEQVEVPGPEVVRYVTPALPDSCIRLAELYTDLTDEMFAYSEAITPQYANLNAAVLAIQSGDVRAVNAAISTQNQVQLDTVGPLRAVIDEQDMLDGYTTQCEDDLEALE